jgi:hypothetical protein
MVAPATIGGSIDPERRQRVLPTVANNVLENPTSNLRSVDRSLAELFGSNKPNLRL